MSKTTQGAALSDADILYERLHTLSKSLEGSGRIDEHDNRDAYPTILDAMIFMRAAADRRLTAEQGGAVPVLTAILISKIDGCIEDPMWADHAEISKRTLREIRAALTTQPQAEPRKNGSISFEEAQDLARRHAKAEPESYYSEPFEPHLWVINAIVEASATWYERAVQERIRRVKAEAVTAQSQAEPADAKDAARYRWLRDHSQPGICTFYLSVGNGLHGVKFTRETVDEAIDAQIATPTAPTEPT